MTVSTVLKWHGGKAYLADWIISHFPPHTHYVEPYFGGGSVLLAKPPEWVEGHSEVANDLNHELANFWAVMREPQWRLLYERLQFTAFDEWTWDEANTNVPRDAVMQAWSFFVRCRQSMAGRFDSFSPLTRNRLRRGMNEQASAWLSAIEGLPAVHERLKRVVILNRPALEVIQQQDGENTLFYLDPPYLHETRATTGEYMHEMTADDHAALLNLLCGIKGKFILSGYPSHLYASVAANAGWRIESRQIDNKASSAKSKPKKIECLWMNF